MLSPRCLQELTIGHVFRIALHFKNHAAARAFIRDLRQPPPRTFLHEQYLFTTSPWFQNIFPTPTDPTAPPTTTRAVAIRPNFIGTWLWA